MAVAAGCGFVGVTAGVVHAASPQVTAAAAIATAEEMWKNASSSCDHQNCVDYLTTLLETYPSQSEALWRLARAKYNVADYETDKTKKKALLDESLAHAQQAVDADNTNFAAHKWYGIILSEIGDLVDTKTKLSNAYVIRDCFTKATELNPKDGNSRHLLGRWYFAFSELSWIERKVAGALFGAVPAATYEEAYDHFLTAENMQPGFWIANWVMLGKTCLRMKKAEEAKEWLTKAATAKGTSNDDQANIAEAKTLLK